jgi:hypothetical protein
MTRWEDLDSKSSTTTFAAGTTGIHLAVPVFYFGDTNESKWQNSKALDTC